MVPLARILASQLQQCLAKGTEPSEATVQATLDLVAMKSGPADPAALANNVSMHIFGGRLLLNDGSPSEPPTVVLGISGKPEKMCDLELVRRDKIPLIKRFSGGGTVIVDRNTIFASIIVNNADVPDCKPYPREIMDWSMGIYGPAFENVVKTKPDTRLGLRENDYVFGNLKFGGNAQAITKGRWLHHTSFLWAFEPENMRYLRMPDKKPEYRGDRDHEAFLTTLHEHVDQREDLWPALKAAAGGMFKLEEASIPEVLALVAGDGDTWMERCRTKFVGADGKPLLPPPGGYEALRG